ncbi:TrmH family RNA methyltransferase [Pseudanabaena sp. PCC 6802]|uniref:TrmH family RNA methyltransferase n=1 Tax=Pseudanabaena sp. PCC 6802 TaxID=118173 RepID=UPI000363CE4B|nr:RNA methyltransferase [Pseudanabaena sp. PCC 6802]
MLTSTNNPLIKQLRQLGKSAKERRKQNLFLLEGTHALMEAIATQYPLDTICCTEAWAESHSQIFLRERAIASRVELVGQNVIEAIATTVNPDGVVAAAPLPENKSIEIASLGLALESLQDPGNMGAIIRSAVAVGVDGILVSQDSVDATNPKIIRATAGQWFRCPRQTVDNLPDAVRAWQNTGGVAIATLSDARISYWDFDFTQPSLILLGNEGNGLSKEMVAIADVAVKIPLSPDVESLNVAIAASLLLYEAKRQREYHRH